MVDCAHSRLGRFLTTPSTKHSTVRGRIQPHRGIRAIISNSNKTAGGRKHKQHILRKKRRTKVVALERDFTITHNFIDKDYFRIDKTYFNQTNKYLF